MNYKRIYDALIDRARGRPVQGIVEWHHIVPRNMGGDNEPENLVALTPEEHLVAHKLLFKMFPTYKNAFAVLCMSTLNVKGVHHRGNNKLYGWARRNLRKTSMPQEQRDLIAATLRGKKRPLTPEGRERLIAALKKRRGEKRGSWSTETREKMKNRRPRGPRTEAERAQLAELNKQRVWTDSMRAKISKANAGRKHPPLSPEARERIAAAKKAWWASRRGEQS